VALGGFGVAGALDGDLGGGVFDVAQVGRGEFDGGGAEIFIEAMQLRRARDGNDPGFLREQPGERDLRGRGLLVLRDGLKQIHETLIGFAVLRRESRDGAAEILGIEFGVLVDLPGEEASAERAEGNESDSEFFERGKNFLFRLTPPERVLTLERRDGLNFVRAADGSHACFGEAEVLHLALLDQIPDGAGDVFDGNIGIHAVLVEEVYDVGLEALERGVGDFADVLGTAVEAGGTADRGGINYPAEFRGDDDLVAEGREGFADKFFVDVRAVNFGGIEEGDAAFEGGADECDAFLLAHGRTEAEAEPHAAEAERGNFEIAFTEFAFLHRVSFRVAGRRGSGWLGLRPGSPRRGKFLVRLCFRRRNRARALKLALGFRECGAMGGAFAEFLVEEALFHGRPGEIIARGEKSRKPEAGHGPPRGWRVFDVPCPYGARIKRQKLTRGEVGDGGGGGDVGLRNAVVPGEAIVVPERPEVAEHQSGAGEQVAEAAPEELARLGEGAVEADNGEAAEHHAGSGAGERGEEEKILRIEQIKGGEVNDAVHFVERDVAAERAEEAEETGVGEREEDGVEKAGFAAHGEAGDRDEGGLRVGAIVKGSGEIELGLDIDFHALGMARTRRGTLARAFADFFFGEIELVRKGELGLGIVEVQAAAAGTIFLEAAGNFATPFGFGCHGGSGGG